MVDYINLREEGMRMAQRGNLSGPCDKFLVATLAAPSVWSTHRFKCFMMHAMILQELHFRASPSDVTKLQAKFLDNAEEPPQFRVQASFAQTSMTEKRLPMCTERGLSLPVTLLQNIRPGWFSLTMVMFSLLTSSSRPKLKAT